jgi:hypothetical protein
MPELFASFDGVDLSNVRILTSMSIQKLVPGLLTFAMCVSQHVVTDKRTQLRTNEEIMT